MKNEKRYIFLIHKLYFFKNKSQWKIILSDYVKIQNR